MARAQGARAQMALAFETSYGTPPAAGRFWRMPFAQSNIGSEQPLLNSELLGYGRDPIAPIGDAITNDGDITVPIDARFWGVWRKGAFGAPATTEDTGVFTHEFQSGGWALPSMAIEIGMPEVPHYAMNARCVVNQFSWTTPCSELISATTGLFGQGETVGPCFATGTLKGIDLTRSDELKGEITCNGSTNVARH